MPDANALITTEVLARELGHAGVRCYDCTTYLEAPQPGSETPYAVVAGRDRFETAHIPGADFLDLQGEFADQSSPLLFTMPAVAQLEAAFGRHGLGEGVRVVLYSRDSVMWATRFWWMLKSLGFDDAVVLDGGIEKWETEGRPVERGPANGYPPATFAAHPRPDLFVGKAAVLAAIDDPHSVLINALRPEFHRGLEPSRYGRQGRIPGSVNVPAASLVEPQSKTFAALADAGRKFAAAGAAQDKRVIAYCGGGIAATVDLFVLHQLGFGELALYDGSMGEWAKDATLPIERG